MLDQVHLQTGHSWPRSPWPRHFHPSGPPGNCLWTLVDLTSRKDVGASNQVLHHGHEDVLAVEGEPLGDEAGLPVPGVDVATAVRQVDPRVVVEGWVLLGTPTPDVPVEI